MSQAPIGVFDSGIGGLSVLREIRRALPGESVIYVADSGHAPYGEKAADVIRQRAAAITTFLGRKGAKAIVVACNTATGVAVDHLRANFSMPIVAIEPAIKPAVARTRSGVVGVLATSQTLGSRKFLRLVDTFASAARVLVQPCPGLVERIEAGDLTGPETRALVDQFVMPLIDQAADTLVLGCTHYAFVGGLIQDAAGPGVTVLDPAAAVARELKRRLESVGALTDAAAGEEEFWTTGDPGHVARVISDLWPTRVAVGPLPPPYDAIEA